jgi:hypothetical protein
MHALCSRNEKIREAACPFLIGVLASENLSPEAAMAGQCSEAVRNDTSGDFSIHHFTAFLCNMSSTPMISIFPSHYTGEG